MVIVKHLQLKTEIKTKLLLSDMFGVNGVNVVWISTYLIRIISGYYWNEYVHLFGYCANSHHKN